MPSAMRRLDGSAPLRVCLATPFLAPYWKASGIAWYNRWLAEGLAERGHSVKVIDLSPLPARSIVEPWGETVTGGNESRKVFLIPRSVRAAIFVRNCLLAENNFDIFETSSYPGLGALLPRTSALKFVRLITSIDNANKPGMRQKAMKFVEALSVHRADATIASTHYIQQTSSALYKANLVNSYHIPFGIPDVDIRPSKSIRPRMKFLSIGRASLRKGTDVLIRALNRAFRHNDDFEVTLVSSNDSIAEMSVELQEIVRTLLAQFAERLTIIENIGEEQKLDLLAASDYLIVASRQESFGLPVIEAMRASTAVISSSCGGLKEVAGSSTGNVLYENAEDPDVLVNAILSAVSRGGSDAIERGRTGRKMYEQRFNEGVFVDGTIAAYRDKMQRIKAIARR